jgi:hypothetical protein
VRREHTSDLYAALDLSQHRGAHGFIRVEEALGIADGELNEIHASLLEGAAPPFTVCGPRFEEYVPGRVESSTGAIDGADSFEVLRRESAEIAGQHVVNS